MPASNNHVYRLCNNIKSVIIEWCKLHYKDTQRDTKRKGERLD